MGNIKTLHAGDGALQLQQLFQLIVASSNGALVSQPRSQRRLGVDGGELDKTGPFGAGTTHHSHLVACGLAECLGDDAFIFESHIEQHLARDLPPPLPRQIELQQEGLHHLVELGIGRHFREVAARAQHLALTNKEHVDASSTLLEGDPHHIQLVQHVAAHRLLFGDPAQRQDLIPIPGCLFKAQIAAGRLHLAHQLANHLLVLARQKQLGQLHLLGIFGLAHQPGYARASATLELIEQTGTGAVGIDRIFALTHRENFLHQMQTLAYRAARGVWAEVLPLHLAGTAMDTDTWMLVRGDDDPGVGFVVPQQHVVTGLVLLDEIVLEDQRLGLGVGDGDLDIGDLAHQGAGLDAVDVSPKIGSEPLFQILGLAHVDHGATAVIHAVNATLMGDGAQKRLTVEERFGREGHQLLGSHKGKN